MRQLDRVPFLCVVLACACSPLAASGQSPNEAPVAKKTLNVLFIGNSYTARHNLAQVVKAMAEAGNPKLTFHPNSVIYGGRRLVDHMRLGTLNYVRIHSLTKDQQAATVKALEKEAENQADRYAKAALARHRKLLSDWPPTRTKWDVVVLQSYRDDSEGSPSLYAQYAPKFARLAKESGARVILYETTPATQNAKPLTTAPDAGPVLKKSKAIAALADQIDAAVAPMSLIALRCQTERPDLTLRFENDAHLNQRMAYLTACALYAALFDRSPQGLPIHRVTDIRYWNKTDREKDRDGKPITFTLSDSERTTLQRIAWEGYQESQRLRSR